MVPRFNCTIGQPSMRHPLKNKTKANSDAKEKHESASLIAVTLGYLQAISCKMPVKMNLWPLGRVNSWATNTIRAKMVKTHARTEVASTTWRKSAVRQR